MLHFRSWRYNYHFFHFDLVIYFRVRVGGRGEWEESVRTSARTQQVARSGLEVFLSIVFRPLGLFDAGQSERAREGTI